MTNLLPLNLQFFADETPDEPNQPTQEQPESTPEQVEQPQAEPEKTFTQAELDDIIAKRVARAKKDVPQDYDEVKQRLEQFEAAEKERKQAEMTELERFQAELAEKDEQAQSYAKQLEEFKAQVEREKIHNAFTKAAVGANIAYLDDAIRLADLSNVKVEDGQVVGIDEIVADLVTNKPYLLKAQPTAIGSPTKHQTPQAEKTVEQQAEELKQRYQQTQKQEDMARYISFKREHGLK